MAQEIDRVFENGVWRYRVTEFGATDVHDEPLVIRIQTMDEEALIVTGGPGQQSRTMVVYPNASTGSYIGLGDSGLAQIDIYEDTEDAKLHMTDGDGGQAIVSTSNGATLQPTNPQSNGLTIARPATDTAPLMQLANFDGKGFSVDSKCRPRLKAVTDAPILSDLAPSELAIYVIDNPPNSKLRFVFRDGANDLRVGEVALV